MSMTHSHETSMRFRPAWLSIVISAVPFLHALLLSEGICMTSVLFKGYTRSNPSSAVYRIPPSRSQLSMHQQTRSQVWPRFRLSGPKLTSGGLARPGFMFPISSCLVQGQDSTLPTTKTCSSCFHIWDHRV